MFVRRAIGLLVVEAAVAAVLPLLPAPVAFGVEPAVPDLANIVVTVPAQSVSAGVTFRVGVTGYDSAGESRALTSAADLTITGHFAFCSADSDDADTAYSCSTSNSGIQVVTATVDGLTASAAATVDPGPVDFLDPNDGNSQATAPTTTFPTPLSVIARDSQGNPVPGSGVTFTTSSGSFDLGGSVHEVTGVDGVATAPRLTAGTALGPLKVMATSDNDSSATFDLQVLEPVVLPVGTVGVPYSQSTGLSPVDGDLSGLPPGLSAGQKVDADGHPILVVSGVPARAGTFTAALKWVGLSYCVTFPNGSPNCFGSTDVLSLLTISVATADQTVDFTSQPPQPAEVGRTYTPTASGGGSGNSVTFDVDSSSSQVCSISAGIVSLVGAGTCTINASQSGDDNYKPGSAQQVVAVTPAVDLSVSTLFTPAKIIRGQVVILTESVTNHGSVAEKVKLSGSLSYTSGKHSYQINFPPGSLTLKAAATASITLPILVTKLLPVGTYTVSLTGQDSTGSATRSSTIDIS